MHYTHYCSNLVKDPLTHLVIRTPCWNDHQIPPINSQLIFHDILYYFIVSLFLKRAR